MVCRQGSSASSDTYGSCLTHMQSSPSNYDMTPDALKSNVYLNPVDTNEGDSGPAPLVPPPHYNDVITGEFDRRNIHGSPPLPNSGFAGQTAQGKQTNPVGDRYDEPPVVGKAQPSPKPPEKSRHSKGATSLRQMFKNRKQKPLTLAKPRARFSADSDSARSHSSTDSVNSQGSVKTSSARFRKTPFGSRHHSSPATGKKLANYHLIANSQSGK